MVFSSKTEGVETGRLVESSKVEVQISKFEVVSGAEVRAEKMTVLAVYCNHPKWRV